MTGRGRNGAAARIRLSSSNNAMSEADTLSTVVTYLEMHAKPTAPTPPRPAAKIALMRAEMPPVSFYRYLYDTIGEDWLWYERRIISNDDLTNIIITRTSRFSYCHLAACRPVTVNLTAVPRARSNLPISG